MSSYQEIRQHEVCPLVVTDRIQLPEHNYSPDMDNSQVVDTFNTFAAACMDYFGSDNSRWPNATMHIDPIPVDMRMGSLSFAVMWGPGVEIPHPKEHKVPEYFSKGRRRVAGWRRQRMECTTLDARGFVGRILQTGEAPVLRTAVGLGAEGCNDLLVRKMEVRTSNQAENTVLEVASDLLAYRSLRFHAGVRWWPTNKYIFNFKHPDDETRALSEV